MNEATVNEASETRDWVRNLDAMFLLWGLPVAIMLLTVCCAGGGWVVTIPWTLSLVVMGGACLMNARRCGRRHCYFTGPFFLLMALPSFSYGVSWLPLGPHGWLYIGAVTLIGGGLLAVAPEWLWGRYRHIHTGAHGC